MCKISNQVLVIFIVTTGFIGCAGQSQPSHTFMGQAGSQSTMTGQTAHGPQNPSSPSAFGAKVPANRSPWSKLSDPVINNPVNQSIQRTWQGVWDMAQPTSTPAQDTHSALSLSAPRKAPTPALYTSMALLAEKYGNTEQARMHYEKALEVDPNDVDTLLAYGHMEDRQGRLDEALQYYDRAVQKDPKNAAALNDLSLCLARKDDMPAAAQALTQAIELQPHRKLYRNNLATVLLELDRPDDAFAQLSAVFPPAIAHYNMGYLLNKRGYVSQAIEQFNMAIQIDPAMQPAQTMLARLQSADPSTAVAEQSNHPELMEDRPQQASVEEIPYPQTPQTSPAAPLPEILGPENRLISNQPAKADTEWIAQNAPGTPQVVSPAIPPTPPVPQYRPNYPSYPNQTVPMGYPAGTPSTGGITDPDPNGTFPEQSPWPLHQPSEVPNTNLGTPAANPPIPVAVTNVYALPGPQTLPPTRQASTGHGSRPY